MVERATAKVMKRLVPKLECLREAEEVLQDLHSRTDYADASMFDQAHEVNVDYMERTFYPNFLKSDVYIKYLQQLQEEAMMSRQSQSGSVSSASSSISGRLLAAEAEKGGPSSTGTVPKNRQMSTSGKQLFLVVLYIYIMKELMMLFLDV